MNKNKELILEKNFERFDYYIEKADNKASFILAFAGALLAAVVFQSNTIVGTIKIDQLKKIIIYSLLITSLLLFITCAFALLVIIPRTPKSTYKSILYFEDVKNMSEQEVINRVSDDNNYLIEEDISKQIIIIANTCSKKMKNVRNSLVCLSLAGVLLILIIHVLLLYM